MSREGHGARAERPAQVDTDGEGLALMGLSASAETLPSAAESANGDRSHGKAHSAARADDGGESGQGADAAGRDGADDGQPAVPNCCYIHMMRIAFLATGVWWGVGMQLMVYAGVAERPTAQLPTLDWYGGMLLSLIPGRFLLLKCDLRHPTCTTTLGCIPGQPKLPPWRPMFTNVDVIVASVCDVVGTTLTAIGLTMSGSAIFGIIFSSVSSWAALLRWIILGERLKPVQVLGILLVTSGLVLSAAGEDTSSTTGKRVVVGIALTLIGTVGYGLEYVLCERALVRGDGLTPIDFLWYMGVWGTLLIGAYLCVYTVPRWEVLVAQPTRDADASTGYLVFLFASHTINNWIHNIAWFVICQIEGSVSTGLLQGLKAILLFAASSVAFCHRQESQCLTPAKGAATVVVVLGTLVYYSVPSVAANTPEPSRSGAVGLKRVDSAQWQELVPMPNAKQAWRSRARGQRIPSAAEDEPDEIRHAPMTAVEEDEPSPRAQAEAERARRGGGARNGLDGTASSSRRNGASEAGTPSNGLTSAKARAAAAAPSDGAARPGAQP